MNKNLIKELINDPAALIKAMPGTEKKRIPRKTKADVAIVGKPRKTAERTAVALPERYVSMSNALARGAQGLSLSQKRLIALALAKTDSVSSRDLANSKGGWQIRLLAHEYAEIYDVDADTAYTQLRTGARDLLRALWTTVTLPTKGKGSVITQGQWLSLAQYRKQEAMVDIVFHPQIAPHLLGLRQHFLSYKLKQTAALRSVYAWRLFEYMESWKDKAEFTVTIEDFIKTMEAPASCSANFKDLRRRVIEPAVAELRKKENYIIEWSAKKAGKRVAGLVFKVSKNPQGQLDI